MNVGFIHLLYLQKRSLNVKMTLSTMTGKWSFFLVLIDSTSKSKIVNELVQR